MSVPDFLIWRCANCGAPAEGKKKPCACVTNVGTRAGPSGRLEQTWWDDPSSSLDDAIAAIPKNWALDHLCEHYNVAAPHLKDGRATCKLGTANADRTGIVKVQAEGISLADAVRQAISLIGV